MASGAASASEPQVFVVLTYCDGVVKLLQVAGKHDARAVFQKVFRFVGGQKQWEAAVEKYGESVNGAPTGAMQRNALEEDPGCWIALTGSDFEQNWAAISADPLILAEFPKHSLIYKATLNYQGTMKLYPSLELCVCAC